MIVPCTHPRNREPANLSRATRELPFSKAAGMPTEPIRRADSRLRSDGQPLSSAVGDPGSQPESGRPLA